MRSFGSFVDSISLGCCRNTAHSGRRSMLSFGLHTRDEWQTQLANAEETYA